MLTREQLALCQKFGVEPLEIRVGETLGVALNVRTDLQPINGLRHPPSQTTSGWFVWAGEIFSEDTDFLHPLHVEHLGDWCPRIIKYLALPAGWRFLTRIMHQGDLRYA
jgi:hypothetical protein